MAIVFGLRSWYSYSEGFLSPADAVAAAKKALQAGKDGSPDCVAFADKGETAGYFEFIDACRKEGLNYLPGIEVNLNAQGEIRHALLFGLREAGELKLREVLASSKLIEPDQAPADVDATLPVIELSDLNPSLMVLSGHEGSHLMSYRLRHEMLSAKEFYQSISATGARFAMSLDPETVEPRETRFFSELEAMGAKSIPYRPGVISHISQMSDVRAVIPSAFPDATPPESWNYEVPEIQTTAQLLGRRKLPGYDPVAISRLAATAGIIPTEKSGSHGDLLYNGLSPEDAITLLRQRCIDGFSKRVADSGQNAPLEESKSKPYFDRMEREIELIGGINFQSRLLVMADFVNFCASKNQEAFARGSAANSVVCWMLGISKINPVFHDLPMERFLNPERPSMPDIDIDIPSSFSKEAFEFMGTLLPNSVRIRQPRETTLGNLIPRLAARFNIRNPDKLSDAFKSAMGLTEFPKGVPLADLEKKFPKLKETFIKLRDDDHQDMERLYNTLRAIGNRPLGFTPHVGLAASDTPIFERIPVIPARTTDGGWTPACGIAHTELESRGVLKFDLLPRQTLDWISRIKDRALGIPLPSMDQVANRQDRSVFTDVLNKGLLTGIDQIHKHSETLKAVKISTFSELSTFIALIRPGAGGGQSKDSKRSETALPQGVANYVQGNNPLQQAVSVLGPEARAIYEKNTNKTRGMVIYDEQFSRLLHDLSDVPVGKCEILRRAKAKGYPADKEIVADIITGISMKFSAPFAKATETFEHLSSDGAYLFPKGHAATYALAAMHLMTIKRAAPAAFVAGYIDHFWLDNSKTSRGDFKNELAALMKDARELGVETTRMDFSKSLLTTIEDNGKTLRLGLDSISNISRDEIKRVRDNMAIFEDEKEKGKPATPERMTQAPFFLSNETVTNAALIGAFLKTDVRRVSQIVKEYSLKDITYASPPEAARGILGFIPGFAHPGLGAAPDHPELGRTWDTPVAIDSVSLHKNSNEPFFVTGFLSERSIYKGRMQSGHSLDFSLTALRGDKPVKVKMWFSLSPREREKATEKTLKAIEDDATMTFGMLSGHQEKRPLVPITLQVKLNVFNGQAQLVSVGNRIEIASPEEAATQEEKDPPDPKRGIKTTSSGLAFQGKGGRL